MKNYSFTKTAVVRNPIEEKQIDLTWEKILELFSKKENREALFLGSPNIYKAFIMWERGEGFQEEEDLKNLKGSLYKYASRLANRSTPFGMFASVAAVDVTSEAKLDIASSEFSRHTKFDMYFLASLLPNITKNDAIRNVLKYYSNNSIYEVFDKYRYVEYYFKENVRFHKISEVEKTDYLEFVFHKAKEGVVLQEIIEGLVSDEISKKDATEFIETLIESQFIVSELEFTVTGEDYFEKLIHTFEEDRFNFYEAGVIKEFINNLKNKIDGLDQGSNNSSSDYYEIHEILTEQIGGEIDMSKLFQVDSSRNIPQGSVSFKTLKSLRGAVIALNKLQSKTENENLREFKKKFQERYEEYEQPLVTVLDPDIGIGYAKQSGAKTPLVDTLAISPNFSGSRQVSFDDKKIFLFKKLLEAIKKNQQAIEITDEDLKDFEENEALYPDTFSVFTNIFTENGKEKINLKSISGPSANGLIGRFTHLDSRLLDMANEITSLENQLQPNHIIAEIVHLPQARTGNILYRNFQRDYEIPYLGNASVTRENQILIDDLYVSVRNNRIVLRSKRLNKEIIPRLSNAHNFSSNALPMYHFLCDIQNQSSFGMGFSWGALQSEFEFLPRVSYKDVLFTRATWNISKNEIEAILANDESKAVEVVRAFRASKQVPDLVYIAQGDNEVLINFNNELSCKVFYYMLKGERFLQLKEFLFEEDSITGTYCNEIILNAHKNVEAKTEGEILASGFVSNEKKDNIKSSYSIGEQWLYYKFYCGERAGEEILNKVIHPLVEELHEKGLIEKWFFIRYYDAHGSHLRFRVLLKDLSLFTHCIQTIKKHSQPFEDSKVIWKTQTDNYLREMQRYGFEAIEATETLFYNDSETTLAFSDMIEGDTGEKVRWLFALLSMDRFLNDFNLSTETRAKLFNVNKTSFGREFNRKGKLNKQVNELFSNFESEIESFLDGNAIEEMYEPLWQILQERSEKNSEPIAFLQELDKKNALPRSLEEIILSYLHMICNRIFLSKHRLHEMVVYDFMYKFYSKQLHVMKAGKNELETSLN